jgi:hypothetical protein
MGLTEGTMVKIKITPAISFDLVQRSPDHIPEALRRVGVHEVKLEVAREILADAKYNSDLAAFDVGPNGMPLPVFNAYRALAIRVEKAIAAATVETQTSRASS